MRIVTEGESAPREQFAPVQLGAVTGGAAGGNGAGADLTALSVRSSDLVRSVLQPFVQKFSCIMAKIRPPKNITSTMPSQIYWILFTNFEPNDIGIL
jgi:hypothetical protein